MKFLLSLAVALPLLLVFHWLSLPWWTIAVAMGLVGLAVRLRGFASFLAGFGCVVFFWGAHAYLIDSANNGQLLSRISQLLNFSPSVIWLLMLLIGGLVGGSAQLTGSLLRVAVLGAEDDSKRRRRR